jgi:ABC-type Fe3+ transport system substrate-binding protein
VAFMDWLTSPEGQAAIGNFTSEGQALFHPNASPPPPSPSPRVKGREGVGVKKDGHPL